MGEGVLYDALQFLVDQVHTLQTRLKHESNLALHKQLKCHFRDKESWAWPHGVADGMEYVGSIQPVQWLNGIESIREGVVEDVAYPSSPRELMGLNVPRSPLDLLTVGRREFGQSR